MSCASSFLGALLSFYYTMKKQETEAVYK